MATRRNTSKRRRYATHGPVSPGPFFLVKTEATDSRLVEREDLWGVSLGGRMLLALFFVRPDNQH